MKYWVMKSEPDCFSVDDLKTKQVATWDGVRNYQVRNMMRDEMQVGDRALFYHSSAGKETGVVGEMEVVSPAYPDPTQFDLTSEHPDPKSTPENPRWLCVDVRFVSKLPRIVTLTELKLDPAFAGMPLLQPGSRLSITPVSKAHFTKVLKLSCS